MHTFLRERRDPNEKKSIFAIEKIKNININSNSNSKNNKSDNSSEKEDEKTYEENYPNNNNIITTSNNNDERDDMKKEESKSITETKLLNKKRKLKDESEKLNYSTLELYDLDDDEEKIEFHSLYDKLRYLSKKFNFNAIMKYIYKRNKDCNEESDSNIDNDILKEIVSNILKENKYSYVVFTLNKIRKELLKEYEEKRPRHHGRKVRRLRKRLKSIEFNNIRRHKNRKNLNYKRKLKDKENILNN